MTRDVASAPRTAWWRSGGETCQFCFFEYLFQSERRCVECDSAVCPLCAITVEESLTIHCPSCHAEADREPVSVANRRGPHS